MRVVRRFMPRQEELFIMDSIVYKAVQNSPTALYPACDKCAVHTRKELCNFLKCNQYDVYLQYVREKTPEDETTEEIEYANSSRH
jgi:hypothetical protein